MFVNAPDDENLVPGSAVQLGQSEPAGPPLPPEAHEGGYGPTPVWNLPDDKPAEEKKIPWLLVGLVGVGLAYGAYRLFWKD